MTKKKQAKGPRCPICGKPTDPEYKPFCSKRCADADLGKWFTGAYAIPGEPVPPEAMPPEAGEDGE
ncbi:DNA gyrase inhibitor YacG [Marinicauda salina]|uniref:DNA gyrase inhibitor YacG n=1 Tax=Marinicauda salina TaxID=2135793 RepID=A0A2U2BTT4_9PROT|nr:DNA gyrase inhibitor YacG [Marinicauda salina]PWE17418.1 DNA gyrase inhibitor YacG [Marinicauda salina]